MWSRDAAFAQRHQCMLGWLKQRHVHCKDTMATACGVV
jgi:hypothetical protein